MQIFFVCYQHRVGFTFTTTKCSLQLTQHILTFCVWRSLRTTNFTACGFRFADDFFCKITPRGPLIYWWYYWKMFTFNVYTSCFVSRGNSTGKKLRTADCEKIVYQLLFTLADTLVFCLGLISFCKTSSKDEGFSKIRRWKFETQVYWNLFLL